MGPIFGVWIGPDSTDPWVPKWTLGVVWYVMCPDSLNWTIRHMGRSYLVVVPSILICHVPRHDSLNWALWVRYQSYHRWVHGRYWYQSFIDGSNIWSVDRIDPWGPEMDHPPLGRSYLVVVPSYDMSCALILLTGLYGWDSMVDIDINPSSMGPIFGVWIGPTLGVPKWTIRHWAAAIW